MHEPIYICALRVAVEDGINNPLFNFVTEVCFRQVNKMGGILGNGFIIADELLHALHQKDAAMAGGNYHCGISYG